MDKDKIYLLRINCKDQVGIVSKISTLLANKNCNIIESKQFTDQDTNSFFIRQSFLLLNDKMLPKLKNNLEMLAKKLSADFFLSEIGRPMNTVLLVSKFDHCLNDILFKVRNNSLNLKIKAVISNHKTAEEIANFSNIPFHFLPIEKSSKLDQEKKLKEIINNNDVQLIVLARYMQVLSEEFTNNFTGKIINIHHSFLPSFKGARPYYQAFERGVKVIGATAHYVTKDLDEGPIIEQDTQEVNHEMMPNDLVLMGRDIEARVLYRAIKAHSERRVFLNDNRTIVFRGQRI